MPEDNQGSATLEAVLAEENPRAAWLAVKANDGVPGVDRMDMEQSARHLREHWGTTCGKLLSGDYQPGAVRAVKIYARRCRKPAGGRPNGGKARHTAGR